MEECLIGKINVLEKFLVKIWSALLAEIIAVFQFFLVAEAHTQTMLPHITDLALYHKLSCIGIIIAVA